MKMKKEYEERYGCKIAVIWRKMGNKLTDKCPFCGSNHIHGTIEGLRVPHCADIVDGNGKVQHIEGCFSTDGTYLDIKNGYIIREY